MSGFSRYVSMESSDIQSGGSMSNRIVDLHSFGVIRIYVSDVWCGWNMAVRQHRMLA